MSRSRRPSPSGEGCYLVTGATGMIGGEICSLLLSEGRPVLAAVNASSLAEARSRLNTRLRLSRPAARPAGRAPEILLGDIRRPDWGAGLARPAGIIHCAANTSFTDEEGCWSTNVGGMESVLRLAKRFRDAPRILHLSTASVVTAPTNSTLREEEAFAGFRNAYTRSKREAERRLRASGLAAVILRPSIVLSRGIQDRAMARSILWSLWAVVRLGQAPLRPSSRLDIVPVDYVAAAAVRLALARKPRERCYHVSAGPESSRSVAELLERASEVFPLASHVAFQSRSSKGNAARRPSRLERALAHYLPFINANLVYSSERLRAEFGFPACAPATSYVPDLLRLIDPREALSESLAP